MAYAAVTSLYHTIHLLVNSCRTSVASSTQEVLNCAQICSKSLQRTLERYDEIKNTSEGVMAVDARIRDEARKLEDAIEFGASAQFLSQSQSHGTVVSLNLDHLRDHIDSFVKTAEKMSDEYMENLDPLRDGIDWFVKPATAKKMRDEYMDKLDRLRDDINSLVKTAKNMEEFGEAATVSSSGNDCDMVGLSDSFLEIRDFITRHAGGAITYTITGMAGVGKTTMARELFNDPLVKEKFECRAFVRVGKKNQYDEILRAIVAQVNVDFDEMIMEDENVFQYLKRSLRGRKFLVVLDDVWEPMYNSDFQELLSENCFILVTSRIYQISIPATSIDFYPMWFLDKDESWELLQKKVFGEGECPPLLIKAGEKIAENCEGLPLLIVTIAQLLNKAPKNPEYWKEVAEMKNSVFDDACDQIYEVLLPSYHHLTQHSKACFLYMAVFPKDYVVGRSRIINLWLAERFADGVKSSILDKIVTNNVVVIRQLRYKSGFDEAKACCLHLVYRHLCKREGENIKFLCILNRYAHDLIERIKDMRHLAIYHNTLLAMKEVHSSIGSVSTLRSVLCTGPYHRYQVPLCLEELKLLRVVDALTIRFYEFPVEVVRLIQLRYLSLTTNANLPPFIHKLWFLEFLIVHQHLSINRSVAESYVPVEIWELQQLRHLQIVGRNLPHPPPGAILPKLTQLLDVGVQTCAKRVLERIPMLEKLRFQIEWAPDAAQTMGCFEHISSLDVLTSLGSVVKNPNLLPKPTFPTRLLSTSMCCLRKLSLRGFGYAWEDMSMIAKLPYLEALKLRCYAFRGEKWEAKEMRFSSLRYLLIEDTDLVQWTAANETFPRLRRLTMENCHKLREIPLLTSFRKIQLVDCNPLAETCANQLVKCDVQVEYSWE